MLSAPITTKDLKVELKKAVKAKMGGDSSPPKYHGPCCGGTRKAGEYGMFSCVVTGVKVWGCAKCRKPLPDDYLRVPCWLNLINAVLEMHERSVLRLM